MDAKRNTMRSTITLTEEHHRFPDAAASAAPWLVFFHGEDSKYQTFCSLAKPDEKHLRCIPQLRGTIVEACRCGWLLLSSNGRSILSLWNPTSGEAICLPPLQDSGLVLKSAFLTSPPTDPNSKVLVISNGCIAVCHPDRDSNWITQEDVDVEVLEQLSDVATYNGRVYAIFTELYSLFVLEFGEDNKPNLRNLEVQLPYHLHDARIAEVFLVESCSELLAVAKYYRLTFDGEFCLYYVRVFKMDFLQKAWIEMDSLENNQALFLQRGSSISCSASEAQVDRNSIFFTFYNQEIGTSCDQEGLLIFNMEQGSLSVRWPKINSQTPPCWMMPPAYIRFCDDEQKASAKANYNDEQMASTVEANYSDCTHMSDFMEEKILNLPLDILTLFGENLGLFDYTSFRATCRTIRSVAPPSCNKLEFFYPCLMFFKHLGGGIYNIIDTKRNNLCRMNIPKPLQDARICFSKDGWLLMLSMAILPETGHFFFFNPSTKEIIKLPSTIVAATAFTNVAFSSPPTSPSCSIVVLNCHNGMLLISYLRLGEEAWRNIMVKRKGFVIGNNTPVFFDKAFYFLSNNGMLCCLKDNYQKKVVIKPQHRTSWNQNYLVECDGKLLTVRMGYVGESVEVKMLNQDKQVWEKVETLGQHMLFVSPTSCFSAVVKVPGMENKIYFPRLVDQSVLFYSLETKKYLTFYSEETMDDFGSSRELLLSAWIERLSITCKATA